MQEAFAVALGRWRTTACRPTLAAGPAGQLVVTANGARTLIGQLVEASLPFLKRHLLPAS